MMALQFVTFNLIDRSNEPGTVPIGWPTKLIYGNGEYKDFAEIRSQNSPDFSFLATDQLRCMESKRVSTRDGMMND